MKKEIILGIELPSVSENYRKPPIKKSKYTEEERKQKRKEAQHRCNSKKTKEQIKFYNDRAKALNTESYQQSILKARKKIVAKYNKKLEELAGRSKPLNCEICNNDGKICFDHCHTNHHFRGWICDRCNKVLGLVKDDTNVLEKLKIYIKMDIENAT